LLLLFEAGAEYRIRFDIYRLYFNVKIILYPRRKLR